MMSRFLSGEAGVGGAGVGGDGVGGDGVGGFATHLQFGQLTCFMSAVFF